MLHQAYIGIIGIALVAIAITASINTLRTSTSISTALATVSWNG